MPWGDNDTVVSWGNGDKTVPPAQAAAAKDARAIAAKRFADDSVSEGGNRSIMNGLSIGLDDEMTAVGRAADTAIMNGLAKVGLAKARPYGAKEAFDATLEAEREIQKKYAKEHPVKNFALSAYGGSPISAIPGLGPTKGAGLLRAMGKSAATTGLISAAAGAGNAEGGLVNRAKGAAVGGVVGATVGLVMPAAANAARGLLPKRIDPAAALNEAQAALNEANISLSTEGMQKVSALVAQGKSGREAALSVAASDGLKVPIPVTLGQRTGDPGQQLAENLALRGAKGKAAATQMRGLVAEQQDALRANTTAMAEDIAGGVAPDRGAGAAAVSDTLNATRDTMNAEVNHAFDAARAADAGAWVPREQGAVVGQAVRESVRDFDLRDLPSVANKLDDLDKLAGSGQITVRDLFDTRARLTSLRPNGGAEARAAGAAVRALDGQIDTLVERDLISGDPASVKMWQDAIGKRREFGKLFERGDLIEALTAREARGDNVNARMIDAGDAANYILGRADLGFVGKRDLYRDMVRLRGVLGSDSTEWNGLRAEVFQRIASKAEGGVEFGDRQFSGVKFLKGWNDFKAKDPRLVEALFTAEERDLIDRFSKVAARVTAPVRGGDNPSNTAVTALRLAGKLAFLKGLPGFDAVMKRLEEQADLGAAVKATSQTVSKAKGEPGDPLNLTAPVTAGLIGGNASANRR
jgi:hypothetical protein